MTHGLTVIWTWVIAQHVGGRALEGILREGFGHSLGNMTFDYAAYVGMWVFGLNTVDRPHKQDKERL